MPYWTCDRCQARLYSASAALRWRDCPVCEGRLVKIEEDGSTRPAVEPEDVPGDPEDGSRTEAR